MVTGEIGADERGWLGGLAGISRKEQFGFLTAKEGCGEIGLIPAWEGLIVGCTAASVGLGPGWRPPMMPNGELGSEGKETQPKIAKKHREDFNLKSFPTWRAAAWAIWRSICR